MDIGNPDPEPRSLHRGDDARAADVLPKVQALRSGLGIAPWPDRSRWDLIGLDRAKFLEGQCTQAVGSGRPHTGGLGFVLEPKGRVVTDVRFTHLSDRIVLDVPTVRRDPLAQAWARYLMLSEASLQEPDAVPRIVLGGALAGFQLPGEGDVPAGHVLPLALGTGQLAVRIADFGIPAVVVWVSPTEQSALDALWSSRGAVDLDAATLEALRCDAGYPWTGRDLDETVLPAESGLEEVSVSYTKGCYCGQEVVARQHYLGRPRKSLWSVCGADVRIGDAVIASQGEGRRVIGQITSVGIQLRGPGCRGLAVLKDVHEPGESVELAPRPQPVDQAGQSSHSGEAGRTAVLQPPEPADQLWT